MEINSEFINEIYEVEKIINFKYYKNKKYYLIKWFSYPISESTWEPKSNLKYINDMLIKFEKEYPYSIDQNMYNIYCSEVKKTKKRSKRVQKSKEIPTGIKSLSKARKIEGFSKAELKDILYEKLKNHLFINIFKRHNIKQENQVIIDLSSNTTSHSEENISIFFNENENANENEEKNDSNKLIKPILE
jgi:hypothetical protein